MTPRPPRLAARAVILQDNRLLIVNAYPPGGTELWCAPGGGVEPHSSLPDNLAREVFEETGLRVAVGAPCLINEFHDPQRGFHQVDLYFRCEILTGVLDEAWVDPEAIVTRRRFVTREELSRLPHKPDSLAAVAWGEDGILYDPLELLIR